MNFDRPTHKEIIENSDPNNPYEAKWHPVIPDEENEIKQAEYRLAKYLRKFLKLGEQ